MQITFQGHPNTPQLACDFCGRIAENVRVWQGSPFGEPTAHADGWILTYAKPDGYVGPANAFHACPECQADSPAAACAAHGGGAQKTERNLQ